MSSRGLATALPALAVIDGGIVDSDAVEIGALYDRSNSSLADAVMARLDCGRLLAEKKASMKHGEWLPWLENNAGVLGFSDRTVASRLMKAAKANDALAHHLDEADILKLSREMWGHKGEGAHVSANSGENEWYTPPDIIERARAVLGGFDLDPASSPLANETVGAAQIFTATDDGLSLEWLVGRIWMNPPYAQPLIARFCQRFADEIRGGSTGIALVNNATETDWFQTIASAASAICFPRSRIRFLDTDGNPGAPLQGQAIVYAGQDVELFADEFKDIGFVMVPV